MMAVMRVGRCRGGIIVRGDKGKFEDKIEDLESREGAEGKDRDDVRKSFSREGEITDKDNKEKCKSRMEGTKN